MVRKGKNKNYQEQQPVKKKHLITEEQLMDKSHMDRTQFIPILPHDTLYEPFIFHDTTGACLKKITQDLNYLLYTDFKQFWATVLYNPSLKHCLSTCLSFLHRRSLNNYIYSTQSEEQFQNNQEVLINYKRVREDIIFEYTTGLMQVLIHIYYRIVNFQRQNKDLSILYKLNEQISRKYILDIPRIFQICQIYGENNPELVEYIIKMYLHTVPNYYQDITTKILPIIFKRIQQIIRGFKLLTDRQDYKINYSYQRMHGQALSQGEEQLQKKTTMLLECLNFSNMIKYIIKYFPEDCVQHCYFNSQIQFLFENIFLQLQAAYKIWNYQTQEQKLLPIMNYLLKQIIKYFTLYFQRCNQVTYKRNGKNNNLQAYLNSLQRFFKQFGRRMTMGKKNQNKNMLLFKIVQRHFDIRTFLQNIHRLEEENQDKQFNLDYVKDFIISLDKVLQTQKKQQPKKQQQMIQQKQIDQKSTPQQIENKQTQNNHQQQQIKQPKTIQVKEQVLLDQLQLVVPKRLKSQDYYHKLYADYQTKFYKGQYEDDYDDLLDFDKRPIFYDQQSSDSQSQSQKDRRLVSNPQNQQYQRKIHQKSNSNKQAIKTKFNNQPKYQRVEMVNTTQTKKKYVSKNQQPQIIQQRKQIIEQLNNPDNKQQLPEEQKRGGQGYKKSNKSYKYKPKDHEPYDKGRNSNKNKQYDNRGNGFRKNYKQKY